MWWGGSLFNFLRLGASPLNLYGIDILSERIEQAKQLYPNINWVCGDASHMKFKDEYFDLVFESTMFVQITDDNLARKIASEMIRVCKSGGYIMLIDWRIPKIGDKTYKALTQKRIRDIFKVPDITALEKVFNGPLIPPIGRFLSKYMSSFYFLFQKIFPFFSGQVVTILRRKR